MAYDTVGGLHDGLCGAVVLLELEDSDRRGCQGAVRVVYMAECVLECKDVVYIRSTEGIY